MIDVHLPAGVGTELVMPRYTAPDKDLSLLLTRMGLALPQQPPPRPARTDQPTLIDHEQPCGGDLFHRTPENTGSAISKHLLS
ncbi:MAG: hypothetical protein KDN22_24925 [Verrucomicrobiae bacterium]|nr:hypothetical protein [Verrucomicrobiae bacterium]